MPDIEENPVEQLKQILEELRNEQKSIVGLTPDEIKELKQWLNDEKAISRAWSIIKTIIISAASTVVAWHVIVNNGLKGLLGILGVDFK